MPDGQGRPDEKGKERDSYESPINIGMSLGLAKDLETTKECRNKER